MVKFVFRAALFTLLLFLSVFSMPELQGNADSGIQDGAKFQIIKATQLIVINDSNQEIERISLHASSVHTAVKVIQTRVYFEVNGKYGYTGTQYIGPVKEPSVPEPGIKDGDLFQINKATKILIINDANQVVERISLPVGAVFTADKVIHTRVYFKVNGKYGFTGTQYIGPIPSWGESKSHYVFQVLEENLPVFKKINGVLKEIAQLQKGEVYHRVRDYHQWHMIDFGGQQAFVKKEKATIPVHSSQFIKDATFGVFADGIISVQKNTTLYYKPGQVLIPFATVNKGERLPIYKEVGQWYVVEVAGKKGFIAKANVKLLSNNFVNPKVQNYTYGQMEQDIEELEESYSIVSKTVIGKSVDGRNIYAVKLGRGKEEIFINASHHAREHMTTNLVMEMIDTYANAYVHKKTMDNYYVRGVLDRTSIWFVPMVNPDGVTLVQKGHTSAKNPSYVLKLNGGKTDFSSWKANIRGVDLNRQYPADWANIRFNTGKPSPQNYKGAKPLSEPEALVLYRFTLQHRFKNATAYHSSGEILYWHFHQDANRMTRDLSLANKIKHKTGYSLVKPTPFPSGGGYTDWFIQNQKQPGFTPEISPYAGARPVPLGNYDRIWNQNYSIGLLLASQ